MTERTDNLCPICGRSGQLDLRAADFLGLNQSGRPISILRCSSCQFRWLNPPPAPDEIRNLYTQTGYFERPAGNYSYNQQAIEAHPCLIERVARFKQDAPEGPVLDAGCATGEFLAVAAKQGIPAVGVEISDYAYGIARQRSLNVIHGDLYSNQLTPGSFRGIHMSHVLEHLPNPVQALNRVRELLAPNGLAYIEVPYQFEGAPDTFDRWRRKNMEFGPFSVHHVSFFSPESLRAILRKTGFQVLEIRTYLPCRRAARQATLRLALLKSVLWTADRFLGRGDIISAWIRRDIHP